jgi:methyl farnesoate epoxidase/farnesoate epoxidase
MYTYILSGVFFSDGTFWVEQRRFTLRHLRDFGFGKSNMETSIFEEIEEVINELRHRKEFQVNTKFNSCQSLVLQYCLLSHY